MIVNSSNLKLDLSNYVEVRFKKFDNVNHLGGMREFIGIRPLYYNGNLIRRMRVRKSKLGKHTWFTYQDKGVGTHFRLTRCNPLVQLTLYRNLDNESDEVVVVTACYPNLEVAEHSGMFMGRLKYDAKCLNDIYLDASSDSKFLLEFFFENMVLRSSMSNMYFRRFMQYVKVDDATKKTMRDIRNYCVNNRHTLDFNKIMEMIKKSN